VEATKEKLTYEQVKEKYGSETQGLDWDGINITTKAGDEVICVGVPNSTTVKRYVSESGDPKTAVTANMNLVKSCLLTHTPKEFEALVDARPGILAKLVTKVTDLANAGIEDLKK